jgi:hypothetical protein
MVKIRKGTSPACRQLGPSLDQFSIDLYHHANVQRSDILCVIAHILQPVTADCAEVHNTLWLFLDNLQHTNPSKGIAYDIAPPSSWMMQQGEHSSSRDAANSVPCSRFHSRAVQSQATGFWKCGSWTHAAPLSPVSTGRVAPTTGNLAV